MKLKSNSHWLKKVGNQRDWYWRGWQIRYSFQSQQNTDLSPTCPILLIHGFGVSLKHWRHNISLLSAHAPVYAIDLLGFGSSQKAYTSFGVDLWSELVSDFWSEFINQPCLFIGNSVGSLIGLHTAVKSPEIAKGVVMLSLPELDTREQRIPAPILPVVKTIESVVANPFLVRLLFYIARQRSVIRRSLQIAYIDHRHVDDELIESICQPTTIRGAARTLIALTKSMNRFSISTSKLLEQANFPMLLIWGQGDRLIPPNSARKLAQLNRHIELHLLDNIGHCPHDEVPEIFHQILEQWLESHFLRESDESKTTSQY